MKPVKTQSELVIEVLRRRPLSYSLCSQCPHTRPKSNAPLLYGIVNDGLIQVGPYFNDKFMQLVSISDILAVNLLLHDTPNFAIYRVEIRAIGWLCNSLSSNFARWYTYNTSLFGVVPPGVPQSPKFWASKKRTSRKWYSCSVTGQ